MSYTICTAEEKTVSNKLSKAQIERKLMLHQCELTSNKGGTSEIWNSFSLIENTEHEGKKSILEGYVAYVAM